MAGHGVGVEGRKGSLRRKSSLIEENSFSDFYSAAEEEDAENEQQQQQQQQQTAQKQTTMTIALADLHRQGGRTNNSKEAGVSGSGTTKIRSYRRKSQLGRQLEASVSNLSVPIQLPSQVLDFGAQFAIPQGLKDPSSSKSGTAVGSDIISARGRLLDKGGHAKVDNFVLQTTMKRILEIGARLESVQLGLSGDDKRRIHRANRIGDRSALTPSSSSSSSGSGGGNGGGSSGSTYTQYDILEGLAKILHSVDQVDQMLDVKEEMSRLVEDNYKLRAREVQETCRLKVKEAEQSYQRKVKELEAKKQKEVDQIRKEMDKSSSKVDWNPGEKQKVLDDFNYLKGLYEKDRRKMEEMLADANRQLRSRSASQSYNPSSSPSIINDTLGSLQKRGSFIDGAGRSTNASSPMTISKRNSITTGVSPLIYSFQDKIQDNLVGDPMNLNMNHASMAAPYRPYEPTSSENNTNHGLLRHPHLSNGGSSGLLTPNGGSSNSLDMVELVDILKAENTQLRMMVNTPPNNNY